MASRCLARFACGFALLALIDPAAAAPSKDAQGLRQVAGILDYIGGDYRGAVDASGNVLDQGEYDEQLSLARDADALLAQAGLTQSDALRGKLSALQQALNEKRPPETIATLCREARQLIVEVQGVVLGPTTLPSRAQGERLYAAQGCATCHGADGSANTEAARALDPRPANFLDAERVAAVSPHRAYYALSFGVAGTAMLGYPKLRDGERWSLAFYVLSLRHARADLLAGKRLFESAGTSVEPTAFELAAWTDEEIVKQLGALQPLERQKALAYLRAQAPFTLAAPSPASLSRARQALRAGLLAYRRGNRPSARQHFIAAYLDGFEPYEPTLAARYPALVIEIERAMLALREAVAQNAPLRSIEESVARTQRLLARAESGRGDGSTALWGAFMIALREGLEIALLIGALLGLVRRGGQPALARHVHTGWVLAVALGAITWWAVGEALSGLARELAEGIAALLAATVLLGVTHWLFGQLTAKRFMGFLGSRMQQATLGRRAGITVLGLSFLATYREMVEIVLFFKALLLDAGTEPSRVWLGAGLGVAALLLITFVLKRFGQRLQPRPFMLGSSVLLAILAVVLTGKGVRALQEAAVMTITEVGFPDLPWLGTYGTLQGLLAQGFVLLLLLASAAWPVLSREKPMN